MPPPMMGPMGGIPPKYNLNNNYNPNLNGKKKEKKGKHRQEVDTNVFQVSMSCLKDQGELATGDPLFCENCQAIFNKHSKIEENKHEEEQIWACEFCNFKNKV